MKFAKSLVLALLGNVAGETQNQPDSDKPKKKMSLDYKQIFVDNPIATLKEKVDAYGLIKPIKSLIMGLISVLSSRNRRTKSSSWRTNNGAIGILEKN